MLTDTQRANLAVAETLERAADLIAPEGAWIGGTGTYDSWAQDAFGVEASIDDPAACKFCLYGAIEAAAGSDTRADDGAIRALSAVTGTPCLAMWNHHRDRTQAEVVAALREAANNARTPADGGGK